jgi:hypothetical protein
MTNQTILSKETLIASARGGNRNAFGEPVRWHSARVYATSFKMLKNREVQKTICKTSFAKRMARFGHLRGIRSSRARNPHRDQ